MTTNRGGSAWSVARICRSACWIAHDPGFRIGDVGFRAKFNPCFLVSMRGGSWYFLARDCRAAFRYRLDPGNRWINLGFRSKTS